MDKFRPFIHVIMLGALLASGSFFYKYWAQSKDQRLPVLGEVKDFKLQGTEGKAVTLTDLKGKVWVADFMFTTCSGICPTMTKNLASLHRSYALEKDVYMVSISVNPDTDTPDVLKTYAKKHKADTAKWLFLTGPSDDIKKIAVGSFKLGAIDEPVFHSSYFTLVDRSARIRGYYDGTDTEGVRKLFKDIAKLKKEK
jgi:protein SCO1